MEEDSGEVPGGVGEELQHSRDLSLLGCRRTRKKGLVQELKSLNKRKRNGMGKVPEDDGTT